MDDQKLVKTSKYLSKHLRHQPERLGLTLEAGGWVKISDLLAACAQNNFPISRAQLEEIVRKNDKQRFSFDASGEKIRANQGHSTPVDLNLTPQTPPAVLFHGTGAQNVAAILQEGLKKGRRHHVHLSRDVETARKVGARHGKPVVLRIDAAKMAALRIEFFVSDNGAWLVEDVPEEFLRIL